MTWEDVGRIKRVVVHARGEEGENKKGQKKKSTKQKEADADCELLSPVSEPAPLFR